MRVRKFATKKKRPVVSILKKAIGFIQVRTTIKKRKVLDYLDVIQGGKVTSKPIIVKKKI